MKKSFLVCFLFSNICSAALIYAPPNLKAPTAKTFVVIHGCLQSAESMALGTGFNQIAEENNILMIYPQVSLAASPNGCWNWFLPDNQRPDKGQLKSVMDEIRAIRALYKVKGDIFLAGISSGATTVAGLLACFPKEFKGGAVHSGPSYGLAGDPSAADRILKDGPPATPAKAPCRTKDFTGKLIVIHGEADPVVNPDHAKRVTQDFSASKSKLVSIPGLDHAWSGFGKNLRYAALVGPTSKNPIELPFFGEDGPSATNLIWEFFSEK